MDCQSRISSCPMCGTRPALVVFGARLHCAECAKENAEWLRERIAKDAAKSIHDDRHSKAGE